MNAFSRLSKSPSPGVKFAAQATVIASEILTLVSGLLPKLTCSPHAGFPFIYVHVWKMKKPSRPQLGIGWPHSCSSPTRLNARVY